MTLMRKLVAAGLCLALPATAQGVSILHPDGPFTEPATGMTFPAGVGDFQRVNIVKYNPDGSDESGGYNRVLPGAEIVGTIYVFRSPNLTSIGSPQSVIDGARALLCERQFHGVEAEVKNAHPDAVQLSEEPVLLQQEGLSHKGFRASYRLTNAKYFGRTQVASRSDAYVFCFAGGKWTVEYRFDYPFDYDASGPIADFMRDLKWTLERAI